MHDRSVIRMASLVAVPLLALLPVGVAWTQDAAIIQLQQDVLELRRVNQQLEQRITQLERALGSQSGQPGLAPGGAVPLSPPGPGALPSWLNSADWERIRPGMPELEVIRILGVPNTLRDAGSGRMVLFYAIEIGTARFLSGTVTLSEHRVVEVQKPTLR